MAPLRKNCAMELQLQRFNQINKIVDKLLSTNCLAFILVFLTLCAGFWLMGTKDLKDALEFWRLIVPALTLYLLRK
jgi:hypothetical protein